jgi:two-component system LytT family response regulator
LLARERLRDFLNREDDVDVVAEYSNGRAALRELAGVKPDVVFLDVEMPGASGIDILKRLRELGHVPAAILVTAFDEYAVSAFEQGATDYLLKPFDRRRFAVCMSRIRERKRIETHDGAPKALQIGASHPNSVAVKIKEGVRVLRFEEIDWIEVADNYVLFHSGADSFLYRATIRELDERLRHAQFVRVNRGTIVNFDRIILIRPSTARDHVIILRDGTRLTLNHAYRSRLQQHLAGAF